MALPFLVLYKGLALLDTRVGLILLYALTVLPIVIWVMRDQFLKIPIELEEAAMVEGAAVWTAFLRIVMPLALPGMVAAFILSLVLTWNEYFFAALLTSTDAKTLPVMVASQTGSQGINWWSMAALSGAAIAPLVVVGVFLERYIISRIDGGRGLVNALVAGISSRTVSHFPCEPLVKYRHSCGGARIGYRLPYAFGVPQPAAMERCLGTYKKSVSGNRENS